MRMWNVPLYPANAGYLVVVGCEWARLTGRVGPVDLRLSACALIYSLAGMISLPPLIVRSDARFLTAPRDVRACLIAFAAECLLQESREKRGKGRQE